MLLGTVLAMANKHSEETGARSCAAGCKSLVAGRDSHSLCIGCLGLDHAQEALDGTSACQHCLQFPRKYLVRRVKAASAASDSSDPHAAGDSQISGPSNDIGAPPVSDWAEHMEITCPNPSLPFEVLDEDVLELGVEEEDFLLPSSEDEAASNLLPSGQVSRPTSAQGGANPLDMDLIEVCRRAALRLEIEWPPAQGVQGATRSLYDGKRLPTSASAPKQLIPPVPACMEEMMKFWDKPLTNKVSVPGFGGLDVHGMEGLGLANPPPVESSVANHLHPQKRPPLGSSGPSLPGKADAFSASIFQRGYRASALSVRALNASSLLVAYQAELLAELGCQMDQGQPDSQTWEEICIVSDYTLRTLRGAVQSAGRAMALDVVGERSLWLNLSGLSDKEKKGLLDAPVVPNQLFGAPIAAMRQGFDARVKEEEALQLCLPLKFVPKPAQAPRSTVHAPRPQPAPKGPKPQGAGPATHAQRSTKPKGKPSFAAVAARNRPGGAPAATVTGSKRRAT